MRPDLSRVTPFFHAYITLVPEEDLLEAFDTHSTALFELLEQIPHSKYDYRYAPEKWTIRESIQHLIDTERIFSYRALRFARMDQTDLSGFDENEYTRNSFAPGREWEGLLDEYRLVRQSAAALFASFNEIQFEAAGTSSGRPNYTRAVGYALLGHGTHHRIILRERYGV